MSLVWLSSEEYLESTLQLQAFVLKVRAQLTFESYQYKCIFFFNNRHETLLNIIFLVQKEISTLAEKQIIDLINCSTKEFSLLEQLNAHYYNVVLHSFIIVGKGVNARDRVQKQYKLTKGNDARSIRNTALLIVQI